MKNLYLIIFSTFLLFSCNNHQVDNTQDLTTAFETSNGLKTATYDQVIEFYTTLATNYNTVTMLEMGKTDSGKPLHLVIYNPSGNTTTLKSINQTNNNILLVNNGIHPGESDGIDASMLLIRDYANQTIKAPKNTIIAVIPVYNIGGALNRNSTTRTNQNGPEAYGFRGNAKNYDLNRDFIKADTKNARSFAEIFHTLNPALFIDNHVSNGADYQYTLTHLFTQHNKLGGAMGEYLHTQFMPALEDSLANKSWDITPYVNVFNARPEEGFSQFMDSPRYSTGYTTLFNTLGMMVETHMLKPYKQRVEGTYELMKSFVQIADDNAAKISELHKQGTINTNVKDLYPVQWQLDSTRTTTLQFKGYEGVTTTSDVTQKNRLKFDHSQPFIKETEYYNYFKPTAYITVPEYYIIPQGYWNVVELLKLNNIKVIEIEKDTIIKATAYKIENYKTRSSPYEGHYAHYDTEVSSNPVTATVYKGDFLVNTQQPGVRYLLETLEPTAVDSFFNWNFFDTILQQKEGFSPYVWEDKAKKLLDNNPLLKKEFDSLKNTNPSFKDNWYLQLDWLHKKSPNYEQAHLRYPILRVGG